MRLGGAGRATVMAPILMFVRWRYDVIRARRDVRRNWENESVRIVFFFNLAPAEELESAIFIRSRLRFGRNATELLFCLSRRPSQRELCRSDQGDVQNVAKLPFYFSKRNGVFSYHTK